MAENLMNSNHKATNDKYRKGYIYIKWNKEDKKKKND
jgi:hypothetical protein